ncbi:MAG: alpha amylase C-terminal domain-containing protein [Planctomycetota bacterium]
MTREPAPTPQEPAKPERDPALEERIDAAIARRLARDPLLTRHQEVLRQRMRYLDAQRQKVCGERSLLAVADWHQRFGLHRDADGWLLREWLPNATAVHLKGPFSKWKADPKFALRRVSAARPDDAQPGVFELRLPQKALAHGTPFRLAVQWPGGSGDRLPATAERVEQDPGTGSWNAIVHDPAEPYAWQNPRPTPPSLPLLVYETHVGMAQEAARVGTYDEFRTLVLPRIRDAGYRALQVMGLAEHPYYGSFGYQVSSFFAASSRFGTPEQLMRLIDEAHGMGLVVLMDVVHSHCARNDVEGIWQQDGANAYTVAGDKGIHPAWGSALFDYQKPEVQRFLLSNCRYWLERYRVDGFRFDGVTSMLYTHHGLDHKFTDYAEYFSDAVDERALAYLTLANELVHEVLPEAITIAEDVSGLPGLAAKIEHGGCGFDYRFAMGVADEWIRLIKHVPDEQWSMQKLWYELTNHRRDERSIAYAESHDQAMVGDQTLIFRLVGQRIYDRMSVLQQDLTVDRGVALHKLIRLLTIGTAGHGYLNFMGNEFGHPEWIDFPREGNEFSHAHARRQWSLADDELLRYRHLGQFDRALIALAQQHGFPDGQDEYLLLADDEKKLLAWLRAGLVFVVNLHPTRSYAGQPVPVAPGEYEVVLDSDAVVFGGHGRQQATRHETFTDRIHRHFVPLYLPARTALVLRQVRADEFVAKVKSPPKGKVKTKARSKPKRSR